MNLYLVMNPDQPPGWDHYEGAVIRAASECEAAFIARDKSTDFNDGPITLLASDVTGDAGIVLAAFNAG